MFWFQNEGQEKEEDVEVRNIGIEDWEQPLDINPTVPEEVGDDTSTEEAEELEALKNKNMK
jgi:hypothetical protein